MRNSRIIQIVTPIRIVTLSQIVSPFWPHENVTTISGYCNKISDPYKNYKLTNSPEAHYRSRLNDILGISIEYFLKNQT